jgi:hypothetical protein
MNTQKIKDTAVLVYKSPWLYYGVIIAVVLFAMSYFIYLEFTPAPAAPGVVQVAQTPKVLQDLPRKELVAQKVIVYRNKQDVVSKLKMIVAAAETPEVAALIADPKVEVLSATITPPNRHGSVTTTFLNTSTGKVTPVNQLTPASWFSFERTNYIGVSVGGSTIDSGMGRVYYKRDFAQSKDFYLQGEIEGIVRPESVDRRLEGIVWINTEKRF